MMKNSKIRPNMDGKRPPESLKWPVYTPYELYKLYLMCKDAFSSTEAKKALPKKHSRPLNHNNTDGNFKS
jgi:hypothetical protein